MKLGMAATIYHWGLHPWAMYAVAGLALAFFTYNKGLPLTQITSDIGIILVVVFFVHPQIPAHW